MNCPHCGSEYKAGWKFCTHCAKPLPDESGNIPDIVVAPSSPPSPVNSNSNPLAKIIIGFIIIAGLLYFAGAFDGIASKPMLTMAKYNQIQPGMSYSQTCQIIGNPGEEMASTNMPAVPGIMASITNKIYGWKNKDGSNMNAMFQNDRLINKAQFGLK